jgi:hypothetical protein
MFLAHNLPGAGDRVTDLNGIVPGTFADQVIKFRIPYSMPGELVVDASSTAIQFNEATFLHVIDKPFEVHAMHVELTAIDEDGLIPENQPRTLDRLVRLRIEDTAKNERLTKSPHLVSTIRNFETHLWSWEVPYTFDKQEGFTVAVDTDVLPTLSGMDPAACAECVLVVITQVRVEVAFQGFLIVIRPASDNR